MEMGKGVPPPMTDTPEPPNSGPPAGFAQGGNQGGPPQPAVYSGYQGGPPQPALYSGGYQGGPPQPAVYSIQQPAYQYSQQQPQIVQPVNQVVVVQQGPTEAPGHMQCPRCQTTVVSQIEHRNGLLTWLICAGLAVSSPSVWMPVRMWSTPAPCVTPYCTSTNACETAVVVLTLKSQQKKLEKPAIIKQTPV